ncbi:alpha-ketoglutarate-dependent dioxygenase AlkB [Pseudonocardia sp. RS11V-5]|uniref:alpha-ketoglutarate-dependent dioxygenase AlkB n=1 Tax=Pseudonocardia terrae TaxID=2905831 RepID=UPI001E6153F2|nr:alpha-ketoglutarate-dependent dioxygenase AlkB [Pseudonocardia terrae]MCE3552236.1 alpha-ketoglutarate-dependent dioxygenase AlkB [Pseudonocardia terrae]
MGVDLVWQPSLFGEGFDGGIPAVEVDPGFHGLVRHELGSGAWVDLVPGWLRGADELFARLLRTTPWAQRDIRMYERVLPEPRLTHRWTVDQGLPEPVFADAARLLGERYGEEFTQVGANLYRDGADSVAWHGDRVAREMRSALVGLVSLGGVRPFRLRPHGGGASVGFLPGPGDLLVMGGTCQRTWQHGVPKVRSAAARISVQFRHAYER